MRTNDHVCIGQRGTYRIGLEISSVVECLPLNWKVGCFDPLAMALLGQERSNHPPDKKHYSVQDSVCRQFSLKDLSQRMRSNKIHNIYTRKRTAV